MCSLDLAAVPPQVCMQSESAKPAVAPRAARHAVRGHGADDARVPRLRPPSSAELLAALGGYAPVPHTYSASRAPGRTGNRRTQRVGCDRRAPPSDWAGPTVEQPLHAGVRRSGRDTHRCPLPACHAIPSSCLRAAGKAPKRSRSLVPGGAAARGARAAVRLGLDGTGCTHTGKKSPPRRRGRDAFLARFRRAWMLPLRPFFSRRDIYCCAAGRR